MTDKKALLSKLKEEIADAPEVTVTRDRYGYRVNGDFFRRVTTYCGGIPKPWLGAWAAKMVAEFAIDNVDAWSTLSSRTDQMKLLKGAPWSKRDDAGDRGTAVHKTLEAIVRGQEIPEDLNEDELACARAAERFLEWRGSRILASELIVYNRTFGYAGTLDLWEIDQGGDLWILDYKTSKGVYAEHAIQQTAYRHAEFALVNAREVGKNGEDKYVGRVISWGPHMADHLGVVHVTPEGASLYPIRYSERLWTVFRAAAHVKQWQLDTDDFAGKRPREVVFHDPVSPEETEDQEEVNDEQDRAVETAGSA